MLPSDKEITESQEHEKSDFEKSQITHLFQLLIWEVVFYQFSNCWGG